MLDNSQQHGHSWMSWDWKKIRYKDLDWTPKIDTYLTDITTTDSITVITGFRPRVVLTQAIPVTSLWSVASSSTTTEDIKYTHFHYKDWSWNIQTAFNDTISFVIRDLSTSLETKGNIIMNNQWCVIEPTICWINTKLILTIIE